ncbi:MAG: hypothetical protein HZA14_12905 [Nitrospirae bacterium]|nr:hypothetical protein [Nitrospirota bacterium]
MPSVAGIKARDGYLFFVNALTEDPRNTSAVVELSDRCGALVLTSNEKQLQRLNNVLNKCVSCTLNKTDDLSDDLVNKAVSFLKKEFHEEPSYKTKPLTFLLLVVGTNSGAQGRLEYIYIRHRVSERLEKEGAREFVTTFDVEPPVPAHNVFYGDSDIIQYLAQQADGENIPMNAVKILACLSIPEAYYKDSALQSGVSMALLSAENGFEWVRTDEVLSLADKAEKVNSMLVEGLNDIWT